MSILRYRLIITDLDGTLVKHGTDEISAATKDMIKNLTEQGLFFTIATGRSWETARRIVKDLSISVPVILQSGAIILDPTFEKIIKLQPLSSDLQHKLGNNYNPPDVDFFLLDETGSYFTTQIITKGGYSFSKRKSSCFIGKVVPGTVSIIKQLFIGPEQVLKKLAQRINREIKPRPNLVLWPAESGTEDCMLEVFDPLASKGLAVKWLVDYLKIRRCQVMAFGDNYNDRDMLKWAGLGVAMEDAPVSVISKAQLVVPGPKQEGLVRFLQDIYRMPCR